MANENTIIIKINADGSMAVNGINQVTGSMNNMESESRSIISRFKDNWIAGTAAITGAIYAMKKAWDMAEMTAQYEEQKTALDALAAQYNTTADNIIEGVKRASNGLISMTNAVSVSARALMTGLNPDQLIQFMRIVETTTNVTGDTVTNSFERIVQAAAVGNERALKQMGIIVDLQGAYKRYADGINKSVQELDELTRQQIGVNAILEKGNDTLARLGNYTDSTADKMERLKILIQDLKLQLGELLLKATGAGMIGFYEIEETVARIGKAFAYLGMQAEKMGNIIGLSGTVWKESFGYWSSVMANAKSKGDEYWDALANKAEKAAEPVMKLNNLLTQQGNILSMFIPGIKFPEPISEVHVIDPQIEKKRIDDVTKMLQELHDREALLNKTADEKDIIQLQQKQRDEMKILADAHASFDQMDDASRIHTLENDALIAEQKKKHIEEELKLKEALYRREKELQQEQIRMQQEASDSYWQNQMGMVNQLGGELGKGMGMIGSGLKGIGDVMGGTDEYSQRLDDYYKYTNDRMALTAAMFEQELAMAQQQGADEATIRQMTANYVQTMNDESNAYQVKQDQISFYQRLTMAQNYMGSMAGLMYSLYVITGKHHKAMFIMYKAFAVVEAIIAGIKATMDGFAWGMAHGGPIVAVAVAAFSAAFAAARVAMILAQNPGGAVADTGVTSGGGFTYQSPIQSRFEEDKKQRSQTINIYVQGNIVDHDAFARELIPSIQKATADNVR